MKPSAFPLTVAGLLLVALNVPAQQPAPPVDFMTLERPEPVAVVPNATPAKIFALAAQCLKTSGFNLVKSDQRECLLEAHKPIRGNQGKDYDAVLLWLERGIDDPATIKVHCLFGRFIEVFGKPQMAHVIMKKDQEDSATQTWKGALIDALMTTGG
jgi:hypothetical protein